MTNAEFLNENFGTDYKAWMKCSWKYNDKILVWMVNLDKSISAGWQNSIIDENTVHEIYVGALEHQIEGHRTVDEPYRLVVLVLTSTKTISDPICATRSSSAILE